MVIVGAVAKGNGRRIRPLSNPKEKILSVFFGLRKSSLIPDILSMGSASDIKVRSTKTNSGDKPFIGF